MGAENVASNPTTLGCTRPSASGSPVAGLMGQDPLQRHRADLALQPQPASSLADPLAGGFLVARVVLLQAPGHLRLVVLLLAGSQLSQAQHDLTTPAPRRRDAPGTPSASASVIWAMVNRTIGAAAIV